MPHGLVGLMCPGPLRWLSVITDRNDTGGAPEHGASQKPQPGAPTQTPRSWAGSSVPCRNETCRKLFWAVERRVYCEACPVERENRRDLARLRRLSRAASDLNQLVVTA